MQEENSVIEDLKKKESCFYCRKEFDDLPWKSLHEGMHHYKIADCPSCKKEIRVVVGPGSGHDNWTRKDKPKITGSVTSLDWFVMNSDPKDGAEKK